MTACGGYAWWSRKNSRKKTGPAVIQASLMPYICTDAYNLYVAVPF